MHKRLASNERSPKNNEKRMSSLKIQKQDRTNEKHKTTKINI